MLEKFHYRTNSGDEIVVPHFAHIPFGVMRKMRGLSEDEFIFHLLENVADDRIIAIIDAMPMVEVGEFFKKWQEASQVLVGESGASSTS